MEILSDLTYSRASFFRRHSGIPLHLIRMYLNNETQMMNLLERVSRPLAPLPPQTLPQVQTTSFDVPLNLVQLLFGSNATVGLGQGQNQFWDAVTVGLTPNQFAAGTRNYENPADVAEQDQCCICQEGITTEAAIHTLCPGPELGDGVTSTNHHALHRRCASAWFAISTRCPVCRADLRTLNPTTTNAGAAANANATAPGGEPDAAPSGGVHPDVQS
jgi:hypothetical protein